MELVVWKYDLPVMDEQIVRMPRSAVLDGPEFLHVASQFRDSDLVTVWARVDAASVVAQRRILIRGTGHPIGDERHLGSVVMAGGRLVWHVFDGGWA